MEIEALETLAMKSQNYHFGDVNYGNNVIWVKKNP
jgi:hypothetical protein